jgi:hypothetical protein
MASMVALTPVIEARAQVGPPIKLGPPTGGTDIPPPSVSPSPSTAPQGSDIPPPAFSKPDVAAPPPPGQAAPRAAGEITVERLETVGADAAGTGIDRPARPGASALPATLWDGTPGPVVERLVGVLPTAPGSLVLQDLQLRLLATSLRAPEGLTAEGALLAVRMERLRAMGALDTLSRLKRSVPRTAFGDRAVRALTDRGLALGDLDDACGLADEYGAGTRDQYWLSVAVVCDAFRGDGGRVEFGIRMLEELGEPDLLLAQLGQAFAAGAPGPAVDFTDARPVHVALAKLSKTPVASNVDGIRDLAVLLALTRNVAPLVPPARLAVAESAARTGVITTDELVAIYAGVPAETGDLDAVLAAAQDAPGPQARARLWRMSESRTAPTDRIALIGAALEIAEDPATYRLTARVFADQIAALRPAQDIAAFAEQAALALAVADRADALKPWADWLSDQASRGGEGAKSWRRIAPILRIAGGPGVTDLDSQKVDDLIGDWDPSTKAPEETERLVATLTILDGLGVPVAPEVWRGLATEPSNGVYTSPGPAFRRGLVVATAEGRIGEGLVLALAGLGDTALEDLAPDVVADTARALKSLGFVSEARGFAAEAAAAQGL